MIVKQVLKGKTAKKVWIKNRRVFFTNIFCWRQIFKCHFVPSTWIQDPDAGDRFCTLLASFNKINVNIRNSLRVRLKQLNTLNDIFHNEIVFFRLRQRV